MGLSSVLPFHFKLMVNVKQIKIEMTIKSKFNLIVAIIEGDFQTPTQQKVYDYKH